MFSPRLYLLDFQTSSKLGLKLLEGVSSYKLGLDRCNQLGEC